MKKNAKQWVLFAQLDLQFFEFGFWKRNETTRSRSEGSALMAQIHHIVALAKNDYSSKNKDNRAYN